MTSAAQKVSVEEVRQIADLSNLRLTPAEEQAMQRDLNAILNYVAELNELDTADVVPMAQVSEMLTGSSRAGRPGEQDSRATLRPDFPVGSLPRDVVMSEAPDTDGIFFKVPKVIER